MSEISKEQGVCPWCGDPVTVENGVVKGHIPSYAWSAVQECPCSGLTLEQAQDKTDLAIMHHAATGE